MDFLLAKEETDFMIHGLISYRIFGHELWITTTNVGVCVVTLAIILFALWGNRTLRNGGNEPGHFQNMLEYAVEMLEKMISGTMGHNGAHFFNYIGTIFVFILLCNLGGLFGLRTPTADFGVTFMLGVITFFIVNYQGIKNRRGRHFTSLFQPYAVLFPINVIGEIANPISLSLRLFGNMVSGVIIMGLWYGMMPLLVKFGIPSFLHVYFDFFSGCIQTYVFCMLTMVYINEKME